MKIKADFFDLDMCQKAYELGGISGIDSTWVSTKYTKEDGEFDDEKYFEDFDTWWDSLSEEEQERIWNLID